MTRLGAMRIAAAAAAIVTALLVQGGLVAPLAGPVPVSLPVVLVAAVALVDGPGAGMALGFSAGLIADLTSRHAAGLLALTWLFVGMICGLLAVPMTARGFAGLPPAPLRYVLARGVAIAAVAGAAATCAAQIFLVAVGQDGATFADAAAHLVPSFAGDAVLALIVVPLARVMLTHGHLRSAGPQAGTAGDPSARSGLIPAVPQREWYG
jgi:hypothetical protein